MKKMSEPLSMVSNIIFLLPIFYAYSMGQVFISIMTSVVMICSALYHYAKPAGHKTFEFFWERNYRSRKNYPSKLFWLDIVSGYTLAAYIGYLLCKQQSEVQFVVVGVLFVCALLFLSKRVVQNHDLSHALWHVVCAVLLCVVI